MIYNSNPYKRKMESMQVNVAPSVPSKAEEPTKPTTEQATVQPSAPEMSQPEIPTIPPIEVTPYVPEVEGVEVPAISLDDIISNDESGELTNYAQTEEVVETPVVESSELPNYAQAEEVVEDTPIEEAEPEAPVDATGEETEAEAVPATHYFYCTKPDGKEVVYKRNTASASYESEITSFRKYLEKEGIVINKEEIK